MLGEEKLREALGTRVQVERREVGGKIMIDFFSNEDLKSLLDIIQTNVLKDPNGALKKFETENILAPAPEEATQLLDDRSVEEKNEDEGLYSVSSFTI